MNIRIREEAWERQYLSPYAALSEESKGRVHPEPECEVDCVPTGSRSPAPFRFPLSDGEDSGIHFSLGDHYRTRLTHTLEVAQISRTVARALRLNEALTEAIALGHDLGHTPFGHAGEFALDQLLAKGFRHNEQSLRVVDAIETSREGRPGLNLTHEVRNGILCHTGDQQPATLEGAVVRICDRVAYINHDIDDAIRAGLLREEDLPEECREVLGRGRKARIDTMVKDLITNSWDKPEISMSPAVARATDTLRDFLFERIYLAQSAAEQKEKIHRLIAGLFQYYLTHPEQVPEQFRNGSREDLELLVADYIAGMTDRYALAEFEKLFLPKAWSL